MPARSYLFVPGDSERKLAKAAASGADVLILDLEDSVASERTALAREMVAAFLHAQAGGDARSSFCVRITPLAGDKALADLAAVMPAGPHCIMLPKTEGPADVQRLDHHLSAFEAASGRAIGATGIIAVVTETPKALFSLGDYGHCSSRLMGMTWGAEDLSAALGASPNRDASGDLAFTYRMARSLCLAGAKAAAVEAIDTLWTDFRDAEGLRESAAAARREGFTGKIAIHPDQVPIINSAFAPTADEIAWAQRVIAAFRANPGAGTVGLDGKMLDRPHLVQAEAVVAVARGSEGVAS